MKTSAVLGLGVGLLASMAHAGQLEEIIVTAQKQQQSSQDVGIAMSVLSADDIRDQRINVPIDLMGYIPNFSVKEIQPGVMPVFTIRGVGLNDYSANNNPTVGVYVDEAYLASTAQLTSQLYDMERIEVLKGPQGTLYGRNSTGGAINFITRKPTFDRSFFVSAGYGNYKSAEAEFMVNVPVSEAVAMRLSGRTVQQGDGYWKSRELDGRSIGKQDIWSGRLQLLWLVSDDTSVSLKLEGAKSDSEIGQGQHFGTFAAGVFPPAPCPPVLAGTIDPTQCTDMLGYSDASGDPFEGDWNNAAHSKYEQFAALLTVNSSIGDVGVTSITAVQRYERDFLTDADAGPFTAAEFNVMDDIDQFTQELRFSGRADAGFSYLAGIFISYDQVETTMPGDFSDLFLTQSFASAKQETTAAAVFGNVDWEISDSWRMNIGARYTWEEKEFVGGNQDLNPFGTSCLLSPICAPGQTGPVQISQQDAKIDDTNLSWKVGVDYIGLDNKLIYASVATGYKSGGFFGGGFTTSDLQLEPFKPEKLLAYEIGTKMQLMNNTLQFNTSAFYYDYTDVQTFTADTSGPLVITVLSNVDDAKIYGIEADLLWLPAPGLDVSASLGALRTKLGSFVTSAGPIEQGNELPSSPDLTFSGRVGYEWSLTSNLYARLQTDFNYTGGHFKEAINRPLLAAGSHWVWNGRASVGSLADTWELSLWGKNLTDENILSHAFDNGVGNGARIFSAPRTFGLTFAYRGR